MTEVIEPEVFQVNESLPSNNDWKSDRIDKLASSLAKAQSEMRGAEKKSTNPFFKSSYADLHSVIQACMPALTKYGLSVVQGSEYCTETNGFYITTTLLHESGQWTTSKVRLPIGGKSDAQAVGGAMTYGRRYGLSAMVGVAQYDDDGNSNIPRSSTKEHAAKQAAKQQGV